MPEVDEDVARRLSQLLGNQVGEALQVSKGSGVGEKELTVCLWVPCLR